MRKEADVDPNGKRQFTAQQGGIEQHCDLDSGSPSESVRSRSFLASTNDTWTSMAPTLHLVLAIALLAFAPADAFFFFFDWPGETSACQVRSFGSSKWLISCRLGCRPDLEESRWAAPARPAVSGRRSVRRRCRQRNHADGASHSPVFSQPFVYDIPDSAYNGNSGSYPVHLATAMLEVADKG